MYRSPLFPIWAESVLAGLRNWNLAWARAGKYYWNCSEVFL